MKKIISFVLVLTMLLGLFSGLSISANAAPTYNFAYDKQSYYVGDSVWVTVTGTNVNAKDWVALYAPGDPLDGSVNSIAWQYIPSINGVAVDFRNDAAGALDWSNGRSNWYGFPAGTYTVVVYEDNGYNVIASSTFTIENAPVVGNPAVSFSFDKESYEVGDSVALTIEATDIPSGSWLGVFAPGVTNQSYGWKYVDGTFTETIDLTPGNEALTWNKTDAFYGGTYTVKIIDNNDAVVSEAATFTVNSAPVEATFTLSMSKDGENPTYYICQNEDPTFTINAENFGEKDWIAIHCADEVPGGSLPSIKYAYIKDINGQAINIRDDSSVWYDSPTRIGHKELPATDYTIYVCLNDSYEVAESISFKVRDHEATTLAAVAPTCTETGLSAGSKCELCDTTLKAQETVDALGHDFGEWAQTEAAVAPTCTAAGKTAVETRTCSRCPETETRGGATVDALGHNYVAVVTAPTCTEQGYTTYTCSRCLDSYVADYTDALGHTPVVTEAGVAATCSKPGSTDEISCSVCKEVLQEQTIIPPVATAHEWGNWKVTTAATCVAAGEETRVCKHNKDHTETRVIPATGEHSYVWKLVTPATIEADGSEEYRCAVCDANNDSFTTPTIIAKIASVKLGTTSYTYDNTAKTPKVTVKDANGSVIDAKYYTVTYKNNTKVGTATAVVTFSDCYAGTVELKFNITLAKPKVSVSKVSAAAVALKWNKVLGAKYYRVYAYNAKTGKYKALGNTTGTTYTVKNVAAGSTTYYLVRAYFLNKAGAEVLSPYAKADNVKAVTLTKAPAVKASVSKKTVTLKWAKVSGAKFYRVYKYNAKTKKYSTLLKSTTKLSISFKNQAKGTNYYLVRAFNANSEGSAYTTKNLVKAKVK